MKTIFAILIAMTLTGPAFAQSNEERIGKLEGGLPGAVARIEVMESMVLALQAEVLALSGGADLGPAVAANTQAIADMNGGEDFGPAIAANTAAVQANTAAIGINNSMFGVVQGNTADIGNIFVRLEDVELLVEDGGGGGAGSPGLVIASEQIGFDGIDTVLSIYPLNTPIYSQVCWDKNGDTLWNCLLYRDSNKPNNMVGYGLLGVGVVPIPTLRFFDLRTAGQ